MIRPSFLSSPKREGYRGKWILKRPPGTGMDRGRKKSQILQQQEQEGSRLEAGAATLARRRNYQASKDRRTSRRNFFMDLPPPSVGWSVCFLTTNVNQAQLSSCQGVIKNKKYEARVAGRACLLASPVRKRQHRSLRGNWGTE